MRNSMCFLCCASWLLAVSETLGTSRSEATSALEHRMREADAALRAREAEAAAALEQELREMARERDEKVRRRAGRASGCRDWRTFPAGFTISAVRQ